MNKIPRIKPHQGITHKELNGIIDAVNSIVELHQDVKTLVAELKKEASNNNKIVQDFITKYSGIINETPNVIEILNNYQQLKSAAFLAEQGGSLNE
jgi:Zn-dependent M32 family carboxypeptidase